MKRKILTLTLTLMLTLAVVLIANPAEASAAAPPEGSIIQDPAFYAAVLEIIGEADGYVITADDVCDIVMLDVAYGQIKSLSGIEHFTSLSELYCFNNQLTELDVSKNTGLMGLDCSNNQLTELDVSKNTGLMGLDCSNNQLTELDVSGSMDLYWLNCSNNLLTTLDLTDVDDYIWYYDDAYYDVRFNNIADKTAVIGVPADMWDVADEWGEIRFTFSPQGNVITAAPGEETPGETPESVPPESVPGTPGETPEETPESVPETGIGSNVAIWITIACISALSITGVSALYLKGKRQRAGN